MPIVAPNEPLKPRMPIIYLYGDIGIGKSSIINTCEDPLLLDFDRGADRSKHRKHVLQPDSWGEIVSTEKSGGFAPYKTIGIDTPKGALDDYIAPWVIEQDARYGTVKWQRQLFGEMGRHFKLFVNNQRNRGAAVIFVAHATKEDEGKLIPDVTGSSAKLLLRMADQIGYIHMKAGKRIIVFEPSEEHCGKNCHNCLSSIEVPPVDSVAFKNFGAFLVDTVARAIATLSEEQVQATKMAEDFQEQIDECTDPDTLVQLLAKVNVLPDYLRIPLRTSISNRAKELGFVVDKEKGFVLPPAAETKADPPAAKEEEQKPDQKQKDLFVKDLPKGDAKFEETYSDIETVARVMEKASRLPQLAMLFMSNSTLFESNPELNEKFNAKKAAFLNATKATV